MRTSPSLRGMRSRLRRMQGTWFAAPPKQLNVFFLLHRRTIELIILTARGKPRAGWSVTSHEGSDNGAKLLGTQLSPASSTAYRRPDPLGRHRMGFPPVTAMVAPDT